MKKREIEEIKSILDEVDIGEKNFKYKKMI